MPTFFLQSTSENEVHVNDTSEVKEPESYIYKEVKDEEIPVG